MSSKKTKVGIFLIGGAVLFAVGLFLIGTREQVFQHHFEIFTEFDKVDTLQTGAKVRVSGMDAGEITDIEVPKGPSSRFRLTLKVDEKFHPIIREDSLASIETSGMVGNKYVNIKKGSDHSPECRTGGTLPSVEPFEMADLMRQGSGFVKSAQATLEDIRHRADGAIQNITSATGHVDGVIVSVRGDVKKITSNTAHMTKDASVVMADIRNGHGTAGKLLTDDAVASNVAATISEAKKTSTNVEQASEKADAIVSEVQKTDLADVHQTIENAKDTTGQLNQAVGTFLSSGNTNESTAVALRDTVHQTQQTMTNLADDTEAVKHNFFLRGFFKRRGYYNLDELSPSEYESSEFLKKARTRVWIAAAGLFTSNSNGAQELSKDGPAILDQNMSQLVSHLPHNPMMIEGYSASATPAQQYLISRQRAVEVRQYLESHFHLNSKLVGIMPLGDHPPETSGRENWDGVCLVLAISKK
ncbi:MAG TPA: MlaD family protein [Bryobacteraceae bacterium]|nr:MlaD family protein [Bryobacteraceae bacterium]